MKNKILIIISVIIFIVILLGINKSLNYKTDINTENVEEEKMSVLEIVSSNFEEEVLKSEKPVLVDFYADWCGPCKMLSPIVDSVAEEREDIKVCRVNIDANEELAIKYEIMSIPTLVLIKNGEEENKIVGLVDKQEILDIIK